MFSLQRNEGSVIMLYDHLQFFQVSYRKDSGNEESFTKEYWIQNTESDRGYFFFFFSKISSQPRQGVQGGVCVYF